MLFQAFKAFGKMSPHQFCEECVVDSDHVAFVPQLCLLLVLEEFHIRRPRD